MSAIPNLQIRNSTDATRGQPLAARVLARKNELEDALADLGPHDTPMRQAIETALATVYSLMTGDLAHPSEVVGRDLSRWLERNKHLAQELTRGRRRL
jgi:replication fork clamp-binding protein CrfC